MKIAGIILIIAGIAALICGGFSFTTQKKAVDMGPIQIEKTEDHSVPVPPLLGIAVSWQAARSSSSGPGRDASGVSRPSECSRQRSGK